MNENSPNPNTSEKLALLVHSSGYDRLHLMATLLATAASLQQEAVAFLTYGPLFHFVKGTMDQTSPALEDPEINEIYREGIQSGKVPGVTSLLEGACRLGNIKIFGCSQSSALLKLSPQEMQKLDGVIGYTTFLSAARNAKLVVI